MSSTTLSKLTLRATRQILPSSHRLSSVATRRPLSILLSIRTAIPGPRVSILRVQANNAVFARSFSASRPNNKGLSPESENPPAKEAEDEPVASPAEISTETYHELADDYMNALVEKLEQMQEETEEVDCEYSVGFLNSFSSLWFDNLKEILLMYL